MPSSIRLWNGLEDSDHTFHQTLPLEIDIYQSYMHGSEIGVAT